MHTALISRIERQFNLSRDDRAALDTIGAGRVCRVRPHKDILREGDVVGEALLILSGWACRYKALRDGRRQITSILLPGDITELTRAGDTMDYSIAALGAVSYVELSYDLIETTIARRPVLARAFRRIALVEKATQLEWALNVGQRNALERLAHLLCELYLRMTAAGRTFRGKCDFPITQTDLADATGLTPVYVNRTLKKLRAMDLIVLKEGQLEVCDLPALERAALFSPAYLQLTEEEGAGPELPAVSQEKVTTPPSRAPQAALSRGAPPQIRLAAK